MTTRIAVLNEIIYRISEAKYKKLMQSKSDLGNYGKEHQKNCELIRKHGKRILRADIMLRDD